MDKKRFAECINDIKAFNSELDSLNDHLNAIAPGAVCKIGFSFLDSYTRLLSESVGDGDDWVSWFMWENGFGKKRFEAGFNRKKIKTVDDLWNLIQESKKNGN